MQNDFENLFDRYGAFYAMTSEDFEAQRVEGVEYAKSSGGLYCPTSNVYSLLAELKRLKMEAVL